MEMLGAESLSIKSEDNVHLGNQCQTICNAFQ